MRIAASHCLLLGITVGIPAQAVHLVGPGGLPQIQNALALAAPGDIVHVLPGSYQPFVATIGCTIRGLGTAPGSVVVAAGITTISPPAGQTVHVAGIDFQDTTFHGFTVRVTSGRATFDGCRFSNSTGHPLAILDADVHLQGCACVASNLSGSSPGMSASNARITAIDSTFRGSPQTPFVYFVAPGVEASQSILHLSHCQLVAGVRGPNTQLVGAAGLSNTGGEAWVSDSTVTGSLFCPFGGGPVLADRCTLSPNCPAPPPGGLLGVTRPQALQTGATFSLVYDTIPNGYAAIFASQELASLTIPGLHAQTQWLGTGVLNLGLVFADGLGHASASWAIPAAPWWIDQPLWFQGLTGFDLPLQLSPVAGGVIR